MLGRKRPSWAAEKRDEVLASHETLNPGGPLPAAETIGSEEARQ
jgi:hypothetical protein